MASSSGSLGGDDSSKLDQLMESIKNNSEKLESLTKIMGQIEDATSPKEERKKDNSDFLNKIEKVLTKQDIDRASKRALEKQADLDRLASNTFRATETIVSEVLSRIGGTSFYPVLAAFRVARESVATATGTPQNELNVLDMVKFVNDASKEVLQDILGSLGFGFSSLTPQVDSLTNSLQEAARATAELAEETAKKQDEELKKSMLPSLTMYKQMLEEFAALGNNARYLTSVDTMKELATFLSSSEGKLSKDKQKMLDVLNEELGLMGEQVSPSEVQHMKELLELEKKQYEQKREAGLPEQDTDPEVISDITEDAIKMARTAAGIAGLGVPAAFLMQSYRDIKKTTEELVAGLSEAMMTMLTSPNGVNNATGLVQKPIKSMLDLNTEISTVVGTAVGTLVGGPLGSIIGSFAGKAVGETVGAPLKIAVDLLTAIESGISTIANDLVGLSPEVTMSMVNREIAVLQDDFRRASEIGDTVARVTEAQTKLQLETRRAFDSLVDVTEPILIATLESITSVAETSRNALEFLRDVPEVKAGIQLMANAARVIIGDMGLLVENTKPKNELSDIDQMFIVNPEQDPLFFQKNPDAKFFVP